MSRAMEKAERLREMERLYLQRAYSDIEMAERLGKDRTLVYRDRIELMGELPIVKDDRGRWKIDRGRYLSHLRVNLDEALALYLAARRASQQTRIAQPHTASALEKLATALRQPMTGRLVEAASLILNQKVLTERVKVLETIARAWVEGVNVRLSYQGLQARKATSFVVSPYLIEPSPWSDGVYLIGHSDVHREIATFKIERIIKANLTTGQFTLPAGFDEQALLRHAWGIWFGEAEPVTILLRFSPGIATRRLKESVWHPTEKVIDIDDGGCLWEAQVAEWQEMLPWVRGWGADVEVLEPKDMRETIIGEAKALAEKYGWLLVSGRVDQPSSTIDDFFGG